MKLLVFAHTPPPHHGQSYMVQLMLDGFGGDRRRRGQPGVLEWNSSIQTEFDLQCYHVNARLSQKLEDIGDLRIGKFILLLGYCAQAIWCRFRYNVTNFYYIPAPGKKSALLRDWMVMFICRPFFKRVILHWHAAGLAKWLETSVQMRSRSLTYHFMKKVDLSIVLSRYNRADAEKLVSREIKIVSNGIPDPCPEFAQDVLPYRKARSVTRKTLLAENRPQSGKPAGKTVEPQVVTVLYLAHCTRQKGLFDTVTGVVKANELLSKRQAPLSLHLLITGNFVNAEEKAEFFKLLANPALSGTIEYLGFVSGEQKHRLLREADLFCFPTYYENENQPVNLIEAMAFGLPILTTRWRSIPELFPVNYPGLVEIRSPEQIARALLELLPGDTGEGFRDIFLRNFTLERHLSGLADAFHTVTEPQVGAVSPRHGF
jgi:glycosyltransferase involved in cell wall biosynthesis